MICSRRTASSASIWTETASPAVGRGCESDTALLVWDPARSGKIESGLQLFGSVTWWIFWHHGYQPLSLLDDDGDDRLIANELRGLSVWQDRNGDGKSAPHEVRSLASAGIRELSLRWIVDDRGVRTAPRGLRLRDGTWLPTYDWVPRSAPEPDTE